MSNTDTTTSRNWANSSPARLRLKVCGMKHNTSAVAALQPDYLGFIFYEKSARNYDLPEIPKLPPGIKKVGVFVDAALDFVLDKVTQFDFEVIQLHGSESSEYCAALRNPYQLETPQSKAGQNPEQKDVEGSAQSRVKIWKVFSMKGRFDFSVLEAYEPYVDAFLFDTKGKEKGGNGYTFDWEVLKNYSSQKPVILSGGIGLKELDAIKNMLNTQLPLFAIDVNSKFEDQPGLKNIEDLKEMHNCISNLKRMK